MRAEKAWRGYQEVAARIVKDQTMKYGIVILLLTFH